MVVEKGEKEVKERRTHLQRKNKTSTRPRSPSPSPSHLPLPPVRLLSLPIKPLVLHCSPLAFSSIPPNSHFLSSLSLFPSFSLISLFLSPSSSPSLFPTKLTKSSARNATHKRVGVSITFSLSLLPPLHLACRKKAYTE